LKPQVKPQRAEGGSAIRRAFQTSPNHTLTRETFLPWLLRIMRRLTAKTIETLPPARGKRYEVRDALLPGLHLRVSASGSKVFYISKRVDHRMRRIKIGSWPILSLHDAREQAREVLRSIELGEYERNDPEEDKPRVLTLGEVIPQFIELYAKPRTRDWKGSARVLEKFSSLYDRPLDQIKRSDIVRVLDALVAEGTPTRANRALAAIKKLMNWCIDRGTVETSPVAHLKMPTKEVARERVLGGEELRLCWRIAEAEGFPFAPCLQLLMLTGQRRGEVSAMRWSEVDLDNATWTIPGRRTKNGSTHVVPLSPLAMRIIRSVPCYLNSDFVFTTTGRSPISGFGRPMARLDTAFGPNAEDWRIHDLRRTVATNMAMLRIGPHIIEAILNHKSGIVSGVALTYDRHAYQDEKREALELWAERVAALAEHRVGGGLRGRRLEPALLDDDRIAGEEREVQPDRGLGHLSVLAAIDGGPRAIGELGVAATGANSRAQRHPVDKRKLTWIANRALDEEGPVSDDFDGNIRLDEVAPLEDVDDADSCFVRRQAADLHIAAERQGDDALVADAIDIGEALVAIDGDPHLVAGVETVFRLHGDKVVDGAIERTTAQHQKQNQGE